MRLSTWLIVDNVHICHKQQVLKGHDVWRCEDFRSYKCPFKIVTTKEDGENELRIVSLTKAILHKFKLKLCKRMREEVDLTWREIWDDERKKGGAGVGPSQSDLFNAYVCLFVKFVCIPK